MNSTVDRVRRFGNRHDLWRPGTRVVAAVSGGSDSVAMLFLLHELHQQGALNLDAVAHLNHGIRGEEADGDEQSCRALAERLGYAFCARRVDVPATAERSGRSIEIAAREARRAFLEERRLTRGADVVATAHTADDQAETVLLRIARGAATRGLGGIGPVRGRIIRPVLDCSRAQLQKYLRAKGESWREDSTNADLENPRNRVRHELLPYLNRHFNPSLRRALCRLAELSRSDESALAARAAAAAVVLARSHGDVVEFDGAALAALPDAVTRRVLRDALQSLSGRAPGHDAVESVRRVSAGHLPGCQIPGVTVEHFGGAVVLTGRGTARRAPTMPLPAAFRFDLPIPGVVQKLDAGWMLEAEGPIPHRHQPARSSVSDQVEVDAAQVGTRLIVRSRLAGDRIRPLGLGGRKKLQDVLVDRKVERRHRACIPIVTDLAGRIVWVAGHVLSEEFRITEATNSVVILRLRRL